MDGRIFSIASPDKPENFAPKGLVCGFVRVDRELTPGTRLVLADQRRKLNVEVVTDIRPARTAVQARQFVGCFVPVRSFGSIPATFRK